MEEKDETIKRIPKKLKKINEDEKITILTKKNDKIENFSNKVTPLKRKKEEIVEDNDDQMSILSDEEYDIKLDKRNKPYVFRSPNSNKKILTDIDNKINVLESKTKDGEIEQSIIDDLDEIIEKVNNKKKEIQKAIMKNKKNTISKSVINKNKNDIQKNTNDKKLKPIIPKKKVNISDKNEPIFKNMDITKLLTYVKKLKLSSYNERYIKYDYTKIDPRKYDLNYENGEYYSIKSPQFFNYRNFPSDHIMIIILSNHGRNIKVRNSNKKVVNNYEPSSSQYIELYNVKNYQFAVLKNSGDIKFILLY